MTRRNWLSTSACLVALALSGCGGGGGESIEGTVTDGGKPVNLSNGAAITIIMTDGAKQASAQVGADGKFTAKGVPAGTYRVSVTQYPAPSGAGGSSKSSVPTTKQSPDAWEVGSGKKGPYTVDLATLK